MPSYFGPTFTPMNHTYPHLSLGFDLESAHTLSDLPTLGNYLLSAKRHYENTESSPEDAYPSPPSTISRGRSRRPALFTAGADDVPNEHARYHSPPTIFYPPSPPPSAVRAPIALPESDFSDSSLLGYHSTSHWPSDSHPSLHDVIESQSSTDFFLGSSGFFDDPEADGWSPLPPPPNDHALTLDDKPPSSSPPQLPMLFPPPFHSEEADLDDLDLGFVHPHSPTIRTPDLLPSIDLEDEFDDPFITSPSSPSLRSFAELDPTDDYGGDISFFSPPSPAPSLLSLPGADDDEQEQNFSDEVDDEEPLEVPEFPSSLESLPSHSLLLIDQDPQSQPDELSSLSPPPRPSSPDHFHIDVDPASVSCPASESTVLSKLVDLRKRSQDAEKKGKLAEQQLVDATSSPGCSGGVNNTYLRNQIRMQRKRDKERSKEISALLRLKLAEFEAREGKEKEEGEKAKETSPVTSMTKLVEGGHGRNNTSPRLPKVSPSKTVISSMPQLVARMTFRRRDSGNGKPVVHQQHNYSHYQAQPPWRAEGAKPRVASPLKKGFVAPASLAKGGEVGEEEREGGEDDDDDEEYLFSMKGLPNDI